MPRLSDVLQLSWKSAQPPAEQPEAEGRPLEPNDLQGMLEVAQRLRAAEDPLQDPVALKGREFYNAMRTVALTRAREVEEPTPRDPRVPMTPGLRIQAQRQEKARLDYMLSAIKRTEEDAAMLRTIQQSQPELAANVGLNDSWWERVYDTALGTAKKGWRGLDIVLRNLDRGRGAAASYWKTKVQGGTESDARRKAWDALRGSSRGFVWVPEVQGPGFGEVLEAAGMGDGFTRSALGFGLDVLVDPVNLLGVGVAREGMIGAHQYLNRTGRAKLAELLKVRTEEAVSRTGVASMLDLPHEARFSAHQQAMNDMRALVNSDYETAKQFLDMGGLKIAGTSLTSGLTKEQRINIGSKGRVTVNIVPRSYATLFARKVGKGMERMGAEIAEHSTGDLAQRFGTFVKLLPDNIRTMGESIGQLLHRTNPAAGEEYRLFKQINYYDRIGYETLRVRDKAYQAFKGVSTQDRRELAFALEDGRLPDFISQLRQQRGDEYAGIVEKAVADYHRELDLSLVEEVRRGFFYPEWSTQKRELFAKWVEDPNVERFLDPQTLKQFQRVRLKNYVPHYYHNYRRYQKLFPQDVTPRAPSITEPFTHSRRIATLREAQQLGLTPETDLANLLAIRLEAASRAVATHEFLEGTAKEFGVNMSELVQRAKTQVLALKQGKNEKKLEEAYDILRVVGIDASKLMASSKWEEVARAGRTASGGLPFSTAQQIELAREMALEKGVPTHLVARMDDAAKREFLTERLRMSNNKSALKQWEKYVVQPTKMGLYDGYALAPGRTFNEALVNARDIYDPFYTQFTTLSVGGLADPRILSKIHLPAPIVADLSRLRSVSYVPVEMRNLLTPLLTAQVWWKKLVTVPWPAFHLRNKITNMVNSSYDIGIGGILHRKTMWEVIQGGEGVLNTPTGDYSYKQLREAMLRMGIIRPEYRRTDITEQLSDLLSQELSPWTAASKKAGMKLPGGAKRAGGELTSVIPNPVMTPLMAGRAAALTMENADRAQHFIMSLKRGASMQEAMERTNRFLFDYDDISKSEELVRTYFMPFYTWARKNLALQAKMATNKPGRFVAFGKFARAFQEEDNAEIKADLERGLLDNLLQETFSIRTEAAQGWSKYLVNVDLPQEDLNRAWDFSTRNTAMKHWVAQFNPLLRVAMEEAFGYDFWKGKQQIELDPSMRATELIMAAPKEVRDWLDVREVYTRDQRVMVMNRNKWMSLQLATVWSGTRFYSTVGRFMDPNTSMSYKLFNFLTGMQFRYVNPQEEIRGRIERMVTGQDVGLQKAFDAMQVQLKNSMVVNSQDNPSMLDNDAYKEALLHDIDKPEVPRDLEDEE